MIQRDVPTTPGMRLTTLVRSLRGVGFLLAMTLASGAVFAEACTYREALMALEQDNALRGMALMRMAQRDGDQRASDYLARYDRGAERFVLSKPIPVQPVAGRFASVNFGGRY